LCARCVGGMGDDEAEDLDEDEDEDEDEDDDVLDDAEFERLAALQKGRGARGSVAAEACEVEEDWAPPVHPKNPRQRTEIKDALSKSFIFSALPAEGLDAIIDAFAGPHEVASGTEVIVQGQDVTPGDPGLYVIASGCLDVYKKKQGVADPGIKVLSYTKRGQSFGELALLYNCPRAATVVAKDACVLWSIDSDTFNNCVKGAQKTARAEQEEFLASVDVLKGLSIADRDKIIDVLQVRECEAGELIIRQGDDGHEFYIVQRGAAFAAVDGKRVKDYGPGSCFGELALVDDAPREADVLTETPARLLVLDGESFRRLLGPLTGEMVGPLESMITRRGSIEEDVFYENDGWQAPVFKKTGKQKEQIRRNLAVSYMFWSLPGAKLAVIIDAFQGPIKVKKNQKVISQGEMVGDEDPALYVLEKGTLEVYRFEEGDVPPGAMVATYDKPGQFFGELALMYQEPRGATVIASSDLVLWAIDQVTFNRLVKPSRIKMRLDCGEFLKTIDMFRFVTPVELERLGDVCQLRVCQKGDRVIKKGERGTEFFLVKEGTAVASVNGRSVKDYGPGGYFGELALMRETARQADVTVDTTPTVLLVLDGGHFRRLLGPLDKILARGARDYKASAVTTTGTQHGESSPEKDSFQPEFHQKTANQRAKLKVFLSASFLFESLSPDNVSQVIDAMEGPIKMPPRTAVFKEGDSVHQKSTPALFVLEKGTADVLKHMPGRQKPSKVFSYDKPGAIFGELALIYDAPRAATVMTVNECIVWFINRETFNYCVKGSHYEQTKRNLSALEHVMVLKELSLAERMMVADVVKLKLFRKGDYVFRSGEPGREFCMVEDGQALAVQNGEEVARYGNGDYFGEVALLLSEPRKADVVVTSEQLRLRVVDKENFLRLMAPVFSTLAERVDSYSSAEPSRVWPDDEDEERAGLEHLGEGLRQGSKQRGKNEDESDSDEDVPEHEMTHWLAFVRRQGPRWPVLCERWHARSDWIAPMAIKTPEQWDFLKAVVLNSFMFALMPSADVKLVVNAFRGPKRFRKGEILIRQGQYTAADEPALFVLEEGAVKCYRADDGAFFPGVMVSAFDLPGQSFGEVAIISNSPRTATVIAEVDSALWWIDRSTVQYLVKQSHSNARQKREEFLGSVNILSTLTQEERGLIADTMYTRVYKRGDQIITKGDQGDEFFIVEEGQAYAAINKERIKEYNPPEYFGELALLKSQPRAADVFAEQTPTRLAVVHSSSFRLLLGSLESIMTERAQNYARGTLKVRGTLPGLGSPGGGSHDSGRLMLAVEDQKYTEWVCADASCKFKNIGRMMTCLSCGISRLSPPPTSTQHGTELVAHKEREALALLPVEDAFSIVQSADTSGRATPRPVATAAVKLSLAPASRVEALGPLFKQGLKRLSKGVWMASYGRRAGGEVGVVQGPFPLAPGECFKVTLVNRGTFGAVGLGLAPLRSTVDSAAASDHAPADGSGDAAGAGPASMVGGAENETGYHGDHGRWWYLGKSKVVSPAWKQEDVIECGLTVRGCAYFALNGQTVAEAEGFWPTADAYPTVTLHSPGAELALCLQGIAEKSLPGAKGSRAGPGAAGQGRAAWSLLANFKKTAIPEPTKKRSGNSLTMLERLMGQCSQVIPAASCCQLESAI